VNLVTPRHRLRGRLLVLCAATLWGTTATLARFVFRDRHVPALTVVELRLTIAVVLLVAWLAARRPRALVVQRGDVLYLVALGLFGVATVQGGYYYSISVFGVGLAILLQYLAPTLIVLYDMIRGRPVTWRMLLAVVCAVGGTALLVGNIDLSRIHATPWQWATGFSTSVAFAFYVVFSKRGLERYAPETVLLYSFFVAGAFWAVVTPPWRILAAHYDAATWGMFLALGVFSTLVPFTLFYSGLRHLPAAEAGIFATLEPVVAVVAAAVFLHEGLSPLQWLGALCVLAAAILASIDPRIPASPAPVGPPGS
jgi:drug/metabolite transporter (DMT)-like permease